MLLLRPVLLPLRLRCVRARTGARGRLIGQAVQLGFRAPASGRLELSSSLLTEGQAFFDDVSYEQTGGLIVQEQHQYAYGAPLPGLSYTVGNRRYRHGYQGQFAEHDVETGFESFELRLYNSRIGRWLSYDPEGQFDSPYIGMGNNPVSGVDPDGGFSGPGPGFFSSLKELTERIAKGVNNGAPVALKEVVVLGKSGPSFSMQLLNYASPLIRNSLLLSRVAQASNKYRTGDFLITRFASASNSTVDRFSIYGTNIKGYALERGGPETARSGLNRRIPAGEYQLYNHVVTAHGRRYIKFDRVLNFVSAEVSEGRGILAHNGNLFKHTHDCVLLGSNYSLVNSEWVVGNSVPTVQKVIDYYNLNNIPSGIMQQKAFVKDSILK